LTVFLLSVAFLAKEGLAAPVTVSFSPAQNVEIAGAGPEDMVTGQFNSNDDHHLDMVVTSALGDGKYTALLGDGSGGFADEPLTVTYNAWGVGQGFFNADAFPDLAITDGNGQSRAVHIYLGDGNGTFSAGTSLSAGTFPRAVVSGLFDQGGFVDLVIGSQTGLMVFAGNGDGTFQTGTAVPQTSQLDAGDLVTADFNNDNIPDLATPQAVFIGNGSGGFSREPGLGGTVAVADGNIDNNDNMDIAVISSNQVLVWLGNGSGAFSVGKVITIGSDLQDIVIADINRDSVADIVLVDQDSDSALVLLGSGNSTFAAAQSFATGSEPRALVGADWKEDGLPDIAAALRNQGDTAGVSVLLQIDTGGGPVADLIFQDQFED
jgi:hypothetical protein